MVGQHTRAIVVDRNRTVARRLQRILCGAGYQAEACERGQIAEEEQRRSGAPLLLVGEADAQEEVLLAVRQPGCVGVLYGMAEELDGAELLSTPGLCAILGHRGPGPGGRLDLEPELIALARHLRGAPPPPLQAHLLWGAVAFSAEIANIDGREAAVQRVLTLCADQLAVPRRVADSAGEVVHELITNAMYDAPVDAQGAPRYHRDRTAPIDLPPEDLVLFRYGTDGLRLAVEVEDRFGRLSRRDLHESLRRGAAGQVSRDAGGAGIGLSLVHRVSAALWVDVEPRRRTRVTAVLELDPARPEGGAPRPGRSLVFPVGPSA
jgi:hypothetical protein